MILVLCLLLLLLVPVSAHAEIFFDSDFETCGVGTGNDFPCEGWDDFGIEFIDEPNHNKIEVSTQQAMSGTKSVKGTWVNVDGGINNPSIYRTFPSGDHFFVRFAARQNGGFQIGSNNNTKLTRFTAPQGYPVIMLGLHGNKYALAVEGSWSRGTYLTVTDVTPSTTEWDQVEVEIKMNTPGASDGIERVWVNDILEVETLGQQFRGPTPTSINGQGLANGSTVQLDRAQIFIQSANGSMYFDRFAVGNTRIGILGSASDTVPPAAPAGLSVF